MPQKDGDIEGASTKIIDKKVLLIFWISLLFSYSIRHGCSYRFRNNLDALEISNGARIHGSFLLIVVEVGRDSDDALSDLDFELLLGTLLDLLQYKS